VFSVVRKALPDIHITISTQANISNTAAARFWKNAGANRIVLARECSFDDISQIRAENKDIEIECFIHGAMCMGISGRCLISNFLSNRGANQGECSQSCRWNWRLEEETRPDEKFEIYEEDGFTHIMSSKDLCLMPVLDKYLDIGIDSFKIEGRHKNAFYIASVARAYRYAIDNEKYDMEMLNSVKNRGYTLGFHNGAPSELSTDYKSTKSLGEYQFAGIVREVKTDYIILEVRNTLNVGDELEFLPPEAGLLPEAELSKSSENIKIKLDKIINAKNEKEIERASAGQGFCIKIPNEKLNLMPFSVAKIKCEEGGEVFEARIKEFARECGCEK